MIRSVSYKRAGSARRIPRPTAWKAKVMNGVDTVVAVPTALMPAMVAATIEAVPITPICAIQTIEVPQEQTCAAVTSFSSFWFVTKSMMMRHALFILLALEQYSDYLFRKYLAKIA